MQTLFIKVSESGKPIFEEREWEDRPFKVTERMFLDRIKEVEELSRSQPVQIVRLPESLFNSPHSNTTARHLRGMTATEAGALAIRLVDRAGWNHTPRHFLAALNNYLTD